ncbi:MAG: hypothetical protein Q9171_006270 [Xanthocarpia ochracea]
MDAPDAPTPPAYGPAWSDAPPDAGPKANQWTPAMVVRVKEYLARGMEVNDITTELFHEFAKPESGYWQERYRKIQEMKLEGEIE